MKMTKWAPLTSQGKMSDEKTKFGIGIRRVELVSVARDNIENVPDLPEQNKQIPILIKNMRAKLSWVIL